MPRERYILGPWTVYPVLDDPHGGKKNLTRAGRNGGPAIGKILEFFCSWGLTSQSTFGIMVLQSGNLSRDTEIQPADKRYGLLVALSL
jgi:hypothetical protein